MSHSLQPNLPAWIADAVVYQIFPERFCNGDPANDPAGTAAWGDLPTRENFFGGDLQGVLDKLPYLQDLGVNLIYLNPIFAARTNHRYDTLDYFQVDPLLGDTTLLKKLVRQAHERDMRVILDGVFNHCGDAFPPFVDVVEKGAASRYAGWFTARSYPLVREPINYLSCGGCQYLPKFNHANPEVRAYILKVARYWIEEADIDGWRLDVPFKISLDFWREFRAVVKAAKPDAYLVGEVWREADAWVRGDVFDGVTNYRLRDILLDYVHTTVLDAEDFGYELNTLLAAHGGAAPAMLNLLDSHDTTRILTTLKGDADKLRILLTLQMTLPGAPMIYYGDEVGLLGETDPDCRRTFPWEESAWNAQVVNATRELIALRHAHPALRHGSPQVLGFFNGVLAYHMAVEGDEAIVVVNPREAITNLDLPLTSAHSTWQPFNGGQRTTVSNGALHLPLVPARSAQVLLPV